MKHSLRITVILVVVFLLSQVMGLLITDQYIDKPATAETGEITFKPLPLNFERPQVEESQSFIFIIVAVLIGTGLILLLVKFRGVRLWRLWFVPKSSL